jgi:hypothetical protein
MNRLWNEHLALLRSIHDVRPAAPAPPMTRWDAEDALRGEWTAAPPGRLGRRLLADVEPYLDFFATARS